MTSIPASRSARAMIFAPRSWPSRPGFAMTTRILRATARKYMDVSAATSVPDQALTRQMLRLIFGAIVSKALYAAARLGIADELASGPLPVEELARRANVESDALHRVLRALAAEGLFTEVEPRVFDVTP